MADSRLETSVDVSPLPQRRVSQYKQQGFLLLKDYLPPEVIDEVKGALPRLFAADSPGRVLERDQSTVRSLYGSHAHDPVMMNLCSNPLLLGAAMQLLDGEVYVHQFKINVKAPFLGDAWDWHQDLIYWQREDGIGGDQLLNAVVFLDEVTEFNGPLTLIPRSHRRGTLEVDDLADLPSGYEEAPKWVETLTAKEKYGVRPALVARLAQQFGLSAPKGKPGSVLFFHPNVVHASSPNISPFGRTVAIAVYNRVENLPAPEHNPRPEFLASRDYTPLRPLA